MKLMALIPTPVVLFFKMAPRVAVPGLIVVSLPNWLTFLLNVREEPVAPVEARVSVVAPKSEEPETTTLPVVVVRMKL